MSVVLWDGAGFYVSTYSVILALGVCAGLAVAVFEAHRRSKTGSGGRASGRLEVRAFDAGLATILGALLGGRALVVALGWPYFSARPGGILALSLGGLAWPGALLGGSLALALYAVHRRRSFFALADILVPGAALGQAVGWLGCTLSGCGDGLATGGPGAYALSDVYGILALRHPAQAYLSAWSALITLLLLVWPRPRAVSGGVALLYLLLTSLGYFVLGFTRGDETLFIGSLRYGQWVGASLALLAALGLLHLRGRPASAKGAPQ